MADRYTQVVILCEDVMHLNFVRRYLIQRGVEERRIRGKIAPAGRGAGTQFVVNGYPKEGKAIRSRPHIRAGLVVVIDADMRSSQERLAQLAKSLEKDGQPQRKETDRIGLLSPKRNIETWIFHLLGNEVDEETNYKNRVSPSDLKPSVAAFAKVCPSNANQISLPSLQFACRELTTFIGRGK